MSKEINRFINTTAENPEDFYETLSEILVKFGIRDVTFFIIDYYTSNIGKNVKIN
jgi:hypothetical protein